jgi:4-carboxymuconolactone decarboxylase
MSDTNETTQPSAAEQQMLGDFAPGLVHFTDDVLFGEVWKRPQLSPRDRSLVTVAALVAGGNAEQLTLHLQYAKDNGATEDELIEAILHLAFYSGGRRDSRPQVDHLVGMVGRPGSDWYTLSRPGGGARPAAWVE